MGNAVNTTLTAFASQNISWYPSLALVFKSPPHCGIERLSLEANGLATVLIRPSNTIVRKHNFTRAEEIFGTDIMLDDNVI